MSKHSNNNDHDEQGHHITPFSVYMKVAGALFALTFLTIIAHHFKSILGGAAAPIAFMIALVKAFLVMLWFMHLKYDKPLNRLIFSTGFFFLALLFAVASLDIGTRIIQHSPL